MSISFAGRTEKGLSRASEEFGWRTPTCVADVDDVASLEAALRGAALVVHAAGPFQQRKQNRVLEAAITARCAYVDVSDDADFSERSREEHGAAAAAAGVTAITSAGIFPGVSNLLAAQLVEAGRAEGLTTDRVVFSYFTAGSGGVGDTILATSYLLAGEPATVVKGGSLLQLPPISNRSVADFGFPIGKRETYVYNLPEVVSLFRVYGVPNVVARFGTSPGVWNSLMALMASALPRELLQSREFAARLAGLSSPLVRAVDALVGQRVCMRVDAEQSAGPGSAPKLLSSLYTAERLSDAVGVCTAAFAVELLEGGVGAKPGVFYPEEAALDRSRLLQRASQGTLRFEQGRGGWQIDSKTKQVAFGFYID